MSRRDGARGGEASAQLQEFSRGLYPILLRADTGAFDRYLSQWEDVIGDTAELTATPPEQLRRTMAALLRRPQQFGLPPWPAAPPRATPDLPAPPPPPSRGSPATPPPPAPPTTPPVPVPPAEVMREGVYRVDMLTGELVPVAEAGIAETGPPPYAAGAGEEPVRPARPRRRRQPPRGMKQLTFLAQLSPAE